MLTFTVGLLFERGLILIYVLICSSSIKNANGNNVENLKRTRKILSTNRQQRDLSEPDINPWGLFRGKRGVPRSGKFGVYCTYNTDCLQNMYCPEGACVCLPGFVDLNSDCVPIINPGQHGCIVDRQCNAAWPSASCLRGQCVCPDGSFTADTRDGIVCVTPGRCPLPEGYDGPKTASLDSLGSDLNGCAYGNSSRLDPKAACFASDVYLGDIYDCIPKSAPIFVGASGICCPTKALTCIQPKLTNGGTENRYWFNSITNECEPFVWNSAGTVGNSNNFKAREHCLSYCASSCQRGAAQMANGKSLRCLKDDTCSSVEHKRHICTRTGFGRTCCPAKEYVCSAYGGRDYPDYPFKPYDQGVDGTGSSLAITTRWYWNGFSCQSFSYNGYGGNFNNFFNFDDCLTYCGKALCDRGEPLRNSTGLYQRCTTHFGCPTSYECVKQVCCPKKQTVCVQPLVSGSCGQQPIQRYWFNPRTNDCETMLYGGCNGNDNNFETYSECKGFCRDIAGQPKCVHGEADKDAITGRYYICSSEGNRCRPNYECVSDGKLFGCCPTKSYSCSLPAAPGNLCVASTVRWYFDVGSKSCKSFSFLGCNGNSNNFPTKRKCERYCGVDVCPYGGEPYEDGRKICVGQFVSEKGAPNTLCPVGYECLVTNGDPTGFCCPTKARICSYQPDRGQKCGGAEMSLKFYFDPVVKRCLTFDYFGCYGNGNRFATPRDCNRFCGSTGCTFGETAYSDQNSGQALACSTNGDVACPIGFKCTHDRLTDRNICCGRIQTDVCPNGESVLIDSVSLSVTECNMQMRNKGCPDDYECRFNAERERSYCCSVKRRYCPRGKSPYINPADGGSIPCYVSVLNDCPDDYSCQVEQNGPSFEIGRGICCSINDICPNGNTFLTEPIAKTPIYCNSETNRNCPNGFSCRTVSSKFDRGYCCPSNPSEAKRGSYAVSAAPRVPEVEEEDGCPTGHRPFDRRPYTETTMPCDVEKRNGCPPGYFCHFSVVTNGNRCCGLKSECPEGTVAYIDPKSGWITPCFRGDACSTGFSCQQTKEKNYLCCSNAFDFDASEKKCPAGRQLYIDEAGNNPAECVRAKCPTGYECLYSETSSTYLCCSEPASGDEDCPKTVDSAAKMTATPTYCEPGSRNCPPATRCVYIAGKSFYRCCPSDSAFFENDPSPTSLRKICDKTSQRSLGDECCADEQCAYSCGFHGARKICLCPPYLLLDLTRTPFKCSSSCSAFRIGAVCKSNNSTNRSVIR